MEGVVFLEPKIIINESSTSVNGAQGSVFIQMSNSSFTPSPPIAQWRVLVPEAAVVQGSPAHCESPLIHNKPIPESLHSNRGEEYKNEHTPATQNDEQSPKLPLKHRTSSSSTVPGMRIGEHIGHSSCIDCHQPGSQTITLCSSTGRQAILHRIQCETVCTGSWRFIQ